MDQNLSSNFPSKEKSSALGSLRENFRNSVRKDALESKFQSRRQQYAYKYEQIYLQQQELKAQEIALNINERIGAANDHFILNEISLSLDIIMELLIKVSQFESVPTQIDLTQFKTLLDNVDQQVGGNQDLDYQLLFAALDELNLLFFKDDLSQLSIDIKQIILGLLFEEKNRHSQKFLVKFYENTPLWFGAVERQRLTQMNEDLFNLIIKHLGDNKVWIILSFLDNIPFKEQIVYSLLQNKQSKLAFDILIKTLNDEQYLNIYFDHNIFYIFGEILVQQQENKKYFLDSIIESILSICCIKLDRLDKLISSGLANIISLHNTQHFTTESLKNLQKLVFWIKNYNSPLLQQQIRENIWFQRLFLILLDQSDCSIQQSALDLLKQFQNTEQFYFIKRFFRISPMVPDNIKSLLNQYI